MLVNLTAVLLPWLEVASAICLLIPRARYTAAIILLAILLVFTIALGISLYRGRNISCGCFTVDPEAAHIGWLSIARNLGLSGLAAVILWSEICSWNSVSSAVVTKAAASNLDGSGHGEAGAPRRPLRVFRRVLLILAISFAAGLFANTVSPRRILWLGNWSNLTDVKVREIGIETVGREQARQAVSDVTHVVIDARSAEHYGAGHLPGAISVPAIETAKAFAEVQLLLTPDQPLLVYCSGKECDESLTVARFLEEQGYTNVSVFVGGIEEWREAGLPIEMGQ